MKNTAIVLAGGRGSRMQSDIPKQYMEIEGRTVLFYSLKQFQDCSLIDEIVLVAGSDDVEFCKKTYIEEHNLTKIKKIVCGGKERYESVMNGLMAVDEGYVFIHDGARPLVTEKILEDTFAAVVEYKACCAAVKAKDTIKIADENGFAITTPDRDSLYIVQTPQVFYLPLIQEAYGRLMERLQELEEAGVNITDDAMVVEHMLKSPVKMVEASYENIKITTPEDMDVATRFLSRK